MERDRARARGLPRCGQAQHGARSEPEGEDAVDGARSCRRTRGPARRMRRPWAPDSLGNVESAAVRLIDIDRAGLVFARTRGHSPGLERAAATFSRGGEHAACWLALGLVGGLASAGPDRAVRRRAWLRGVWVVAASYGVNQAIKFVVRRHRPDLDGLPPLTPVVTQLSFPSAHATTSFAAA